MAPNLIDEVLMNSKPFILFLLVLCFAVSFSRLCAGEDPKTALTVKNIAFSREGGSGEKVSLFCNQSCVPELSSLEGDSPRVVMDMKGVSQIQTKTRNVNTEGTFVKRVRSYFDKQTKILRVVLDMEPSKYYTVRPMQDPSGNTYALTIHEAISLSEQKPGGSKDAEGSPMSQEKHITILRPDLRPGEQEGKLQEAAPRMEKRRVVKAAKDVPSVDQGRSQLNAGEFAAAADTFTRIIVADPQDSLSYRLRGNAYDNLADRKKALADWKRAARLGDTTIQSYLDFLKVKWRGKPAP
jgi:tetratricopeptide (TPR) repeat protein